MDKKQVKLFIALRHETQIDLCKHLGITKRTLMNYYSANDFPTWFPLALNGLDSESFQIAIER